MLQAFVLMLLYPSHLETEGSGSGGWHLDAADEKAVNDLFGSSSAAVFASINMLFFGVSSLQSVVLYCTH